MATTSGVLTTTSTSGLLQGLNAQHEDAYRKMNAAFGGNFSTEEPARAVYYSARNILEKEK